MYERYRSKTFFGVMITVKNWVQYFNASHKNSNVYNSMKTSNFVGKSIIWIGFS